MTHVKFFKFFVFFKNSNHLWSIIINDHLSGNVRKCHGSGNGQGINIIQGQGSARYLYSELGKFIF